MIKSIAGSKTVDVKGGSTFMPYVNMNNASAGMMRYNGNNESVEVYDGASWLRLVANDANIEPPIHVE